MAGHKDALDLAQRAAATKGALKVVPLAVSGAFHTSLMKPAQDALIKVRRLAACTRCQLRSAASAASRCAALLSQFSVQSAHRGALQRRCSSSSAGWVAPAVCRLGAP